MPWRPYRDRSARRSSVDPAQREIGWIDAGGGYSKVFSRPSFQDQLPPGSTETPADQRGVPDVGYQASSRTGVLVYITEPGYTGLTCSDGTLAAVLQRGS